MSANVAYINLDAISHNVQTLKQIARNSEFMAVVKANAYGHGLVEVARAAEQAGAEWLGSSSPQEMLHLRQENLKARMLAWLWASDDPLEEAIGHDIDVSVSSVAMLDRICGARVSKRARIHLKVDTGLSRAGCTPDDWCELVERSIALQKQNRVEVVGVWSHFASAEDLTSPQTSDQLNAFEQALEVVKAYDIEGITRHIANSAGGLLHPSSRYDMVRFGLALYGLSPAPENGTFDLQPAMRMTSEIVQTKRVRRDTRVSYGGDYTCAEDTVLGLVAFGYADGMPRHLDGTAKVTIDGRRYPVVGRVAMDQLVVDLGKNTKVTIGDRVVIFGGETEGLVTELASHAFTIERDILVGSGGRVDRRFSIDAHL